MQTALHDTEWDHVWSEHDRHVPAPPSSSPAKALKRPGTRKARHFRLAALALLALALPAQLLSDDGVTQGLSREALFSFSPIEVALPPLDASIARLAAESAGATCWVLDLRPQGSGCPPR